MQNKIQLAQLCVIRDDEVVYWVSIGRYEAVADGNCNVAGSVEGIYAFLY